MERIGSFGEKKKKAKRRNLQFRAAGIIQMQIRTQFEYLKPEERLLCACTMKIKQALFYVPPDPMDSFNHIPSEETS